MDARILNGATIGAGRRLRLDAPIATMLARADVQERAAEPAEGALEGMKPFEIVSIEPLDQKGLEVLQRLSSFISGTRAAPSSFSTKTMKLRHHQLARMLAAGVKLKEAAAAAGMHAQTAHLLQASPAFQNLLVSYMQLFDQATMDYKQKLEAAAGVAVTELHDRLVSSPETFNNETLRRTVETLSDRTGHGPTSKVVSASMALTPADLRALKLGLAPAVVSAEVVEPAKEPDRGESPNGGPVRGENFPRADAGAEEGAQVSAQDPGGTPPAAPGVEAL